MKNLVVKFRKIAIKNQVLISIAAIAGYFFFSTWLEASYVASKFPVYIFEGQTSFDAQKVKSWYAFMIEQNTFDIYLQTQLIDFLFIFLIIVMGFCVWTLVANFHNENTFFRKWGYYLAYALPLAGLFDIFENLVSFFMIADPIGFADWLVMPYSAFAVVKFAFWGIALIGILISLITLLFKFIISKFKKLQLV